MGQYRKVCGGSEDPELFYNNDLGSRRVVIDSSGAVTDEFSHSAWGDVTHVQGSSGYLASFSGKHDGSWDVTDGELTITKFGQEVEGEFDLSDEDGNFLIGSFFLDGPDGSQVTITSGAWEDDNAPDDVDDCDAISGTVYVETYDEGNKIKGSVENLVFDEFPGEMLDGEFDVFYALNG